MLVRSDLDFILKQIKISEAHATSGVLNPDGTTTLVDGTPLQDLIPNIRLASRPALGRWQRKQPAAHGRFQSDGLRRGRYDLPAVAAPGIPNRRRAAGRFLWSWFASRVNADVLPADQRVRVRRRSAHYLQPDR